jgi:hypothetical protein
MSKSSTGTVAAADMQLAKRLAFTCHQMYASPSTRLLSPCPAFDLSHLPPAQALCGRGVHVCEAADAGCLCFVRLHIT